VDNRFPGSDEVLMYVKKSLQRSSQLGVKQTLFDVYREYKRGFLDYCQLLERKLLPVSTHCRWAEARERYCLGRYTLIRLVELRSYLPSAFCFFRWLC